MQCSFPSRLVFVDSHGHWVFTCRDYNSDAPTEEAEDTPVQRPVGITRLVLAKHISPCLPLPQLLFATPHTAAIQPANEPNNEEERETGL